MNNNKKEQQLRYGLQLENYFVDYLQNLNQEDHGQNQSNFERKWLNQDQTSKISDNVLKKQTSLDNQLYLIDNKVLFQDEEEEIQTNNLKLSPNFHETAQNLSLSQIVLLSDKLKRERQLINQKIDKLLIENKEKPSPQLRFKKHVQMQKTEKTNKEFDFQNFIREQRLKQQASPLTKQIKSKADSLRQSQGKNFNTFSFEDCSCSKD